MTAFRAPTPEELPTPKQLMRGASIAVLVAALLAVLVVLPAERAIDPTGVGRILGLTQMGEIKQALAAEAEADRLGIPVSPREPAVTPPQAMAQTEAPGAPKSEAAAQVKVQEMSLTLAPNQGAEIKVDMLKGQVIRYRWVTDGSPVNFDTHGDAPGVQYHGYGKGTGVAEDSGALTAAFDGAHGWFWRNRSDAPVTITLRVEGEFTEVRRVI